MKRLQHLALALGFTGSLFLGVNGLQPRSAQALSEAQVLSRLTSVPIFTLVDDKGTPVFGADPNQKPPKPIVLFFTHQKEAQDALASYRKAQPEKGKSAQVLLLSMKDALESFKKIRGENDIKYSIEPNLTQLQTAISLLKSNGEVVSQGDQLMTKDGKPFVSGVPLFYAMATGPDGKSGFVTGTREVTVNGKKQTENYVPVYFSKADLERDLAAVTKAQPQAKVEVKVTMFNNFLAYLYNAKSEAEVPFQLVPSDEAAQFANQLLQEAQKNQKPAQK
ncbi:Tic22 family protein [Lyngbya confervoides]|uniref:Tic22 family protein n=1 Tax=Lyngbya confervoides BDU141951 TaxID=1574623 RepID=A0ABD4SY65_9CYAN|nr:Tic22 family protein [Lyngbya confervoides]MCM1981333.1 hypothetical protein [Lyngbya confervoides BDU141951]